MTDSLTITVPDIGDFSDIPVIEVLVAPGDRVDVESPLVTLESDKAPMDVTVAHTQGLSSRFWSPWGIRCRRARKS